MNDLLHTLLGAGLVSIGVLVAALSDRIRQLRAMHASTSARAPQRSLHAEESAPARETASRDVKPRAAEAAPRRPLHAEESGSGDVVAVLVAAGYRKIIAAQAVSACTAAEQATPESWTKAALRRCAMGGAS